MMKIILRSIILCLFLSGEAFAGLKEVGLGEVPADIKDQIKNQFDKNIKKKKNKDKKFILYFYTDGGSNNSVWDSTFADEITDKLHEKIFKKCTKQIRKYKISKTAECSLYATDNQVVWNFSAETNDKEISDKIALYSKPFIQLKDKKNRKIF